MSLNDIRQSGKVLQLDRERRLKFDLNAFAVLEETFGDINAAFESMQSGSMKAARTLLWAGLLHEDEALTEKYVGSLITLGRLADVITVVTEAISDSLPQDKAEKNTKNPLTERAE